MQAYREAFSEGDTRMVLTPDSEFFRFFRESPNSLPGAPGQTSAPR
jgi:membrane protease subunit HflC